MNSRDYKNFRSGSWYHIYNRGHNREGVFIDSQDYLAFFKRLSFILAIEEVGFKTHIIPLEKNCFSIMAYCLMPNHFHILMRQNTDVSIASLMKKLGTSYAKYFNARYDKLGDVFQDSFKAKLVDSDSYLTYLSAYIHNNPENPFSYEYSSIKEYLDPKNVKLCDTGILLNYFESDLSKYISFVERYNLNQHNKIKHLTF
jgi:putative transposase